MAAVTCLRDALLFISCMLTITSNQGAQGRALTATVGGSQLLPCGFVAPDDSWADSSIITWKKQGIEVPIFIKFRSYPPHVNSNYQGRLHIGEGASVELLNIRATDEGWYECAVVSLHEEEEPAHSNRIRLSVTTAIDE